MLHYQVPYIPFIVPWPDEDEAEKNLKISLQKNPKHIDSNFQLGEFYLEEGKKELAKQYLKYAVDYPVDSNYIIEHLDTKADAIKYLKEKF